ncbi:MULTISPECIES: hypothetical protein [unclassified Erwinia]|uniref:hypothetical protein n=1 Tax=unclassified Erwinia TaxID=2622719 RepID=UPI000C18067E|nr:MULTISPECIES: hypothetical protein [unclassified Erwinia]
MACQIWDAAAATTPPASIYHYQADPSSAAIKPANHQVKKTTSSVLPFWGDEARQRGYDLPEPFGVNVNYMNMRQNINVESIKFSGLALGPIPLDNAFSLNAGHTRERSKTETLKLDTWLLPFLNVYGLVGHTDGHSVSNVSVGINMPGGGTLRPDSLQNLKFQLDFKGTTYGAGTTLVGGIDNWFTSLDANYTQTRFNILDGSIDAFTLSPRIGYRFTTPGIDRIHLPSGKLSVWVGSMYQNVQQQFKGSLNDLHMPSADLRQLLALANGEGHGRFDVKQHLQSPWNALVGTQYEITRNFNVTTEFGFMKRNSFFVAGEFRF